MTRTLLLIRHAKSDRSTGLSDHDRPLNRRGQADAPRMGRWIADRGLAPPEVLCSDARRTRETLDLMLPEWAPAPAVSHHRALYHADPDEMLAVLEGAGGDHLALVGHNPGIGQLAARLAARAPDHPRWDDYPTCAVAALRFDAADWASLRDGTGEALAFAVPGDL